MTQTLRWSAVCASPDCVCSRAMGVFLSSDLYSSTLQFSATLLIMPEESDAPTRCISPETARATHLRLAHSWSLHTSACCWGQYEEDAVPHRGALSLFSHDEQHTLLAHNLVNRSDGAIPSLRLTRLWARRHLTASRPWKEA